MAKRKRRQIEDGEFQDPLKDYNAPKFADELERALCEDTLTALQCTPVQTIGPEATVEQAVKKMAELDVGSLLITDDDRLIGIFSERDVLNRIVFQYDQVKHQPVTQFMTPNPVVAYETDSPAKALNLMAIGGFRHVPVLDVDDRVVGVLGPRRVTAYLQKLMPSG